MAATTATVVAVSALAYGAYKDQEAASSVAAQERKNQAAQDQLTEIRLKQLEAQRGQQIEKVGNQAKQIIGAQKSAQAASGVVVNKGSALDLSKETERMALEDIETIKNNASLEAWGYKTQGRIATLQANANAAAAQNRSEASLISSVGTAATLLGK